MPPISIAFRELAAAPAGERRDEMSSARLCRAAPYAALLALFLAIPALFAGPATAARHRAHARHVGPALGVMWDRSKSRHLVRRHSLPTLSTSFLRSLQLHRKTPRHRNARRPYVVCPQPQPDPACNMTYHNGALVIGPHTTHVVYWEPPGSTVTANYHTLIERYLTDVAADSGRATNVYATDTQYDDSTNTFIQYQQTFAGALTDTNAFPATVAGCPLTDGTRTVGNCLTETQEATELDNFIQANSLPRGLDHIYFLVLPDSVETCYDDFSWCGNILEPVAKRYCAYHSSFNIGGHGLTLWANQPYIGFASNHCNSGVASARPNGDLTDHELNVLSHEHNETITDPTGGGWFDVDGSGENGDKCNFDFGTKIASNGNGDYNQLINHNPYEVQQEWSNAITGCALNYGAVAPTATFTFSPPSPHALDPVSFDGTTSHSNNSGGYIIDYQWDFGDTGTGSGPTPSHTYAASGTYTVTLTVEDDAGLHASVTHDVTVVQRPTTTTYTGDTTGDYHDLVTLSGTLQDTATSGALMGKTLTFTLGAQSCAGVTDATGFASCQLTLNQVPGPYSVTADFAGDSVYAPSSDTEPFTITTEETTLTYTGPTVILGNASSLTVSATLAEDGANDDDGDGGSAPPNPSGQTVTFTLGSQSCSGTTDASGDVSCTISPVSSQLGNQTLTADFAGDAYYDPSSDTAEVVVFQFPSSGAFTLGDLTVAGAGSSTVTWWSHSWSSLNSLSGGSAPASFKGFAADVTLPQMSPPELCGTSFTSRTGNSAHPPDTVPAYMGVLVASSVTQSGSTINGTWGSIVVVRTDPGYEPNPGHPGTGTIVATFC
jgi:PKD repeat protein